MVAASAMLAQSEQAHPDQVKTPQYQLAYGSAFEIGIEAHLQSLLSGPAGAILSAAAIGKLSGVGGKVPANFKVYQTPNGDKVYESPGGLVYGPGSIHGDRLSHVLDHTKVNLNKANHTVFNAKGSKSLTIVDEAWMEKGLPIHGNPGSYDVPMGRTIGTSGETTVRIVVKQGTNQIITAYPK